MKYKLFLAVFILLSACVPKKEFQKVQQSKNECASAREKLERENRKMKVENKELESKLGVLKDKVARLEKDSVQRAKRITFYKNKNERLEDKYRSLKSTQNQLLKGTDKETKELLREIQTTQETLQQKEDRLRLLADDLNSKEQNLSQLRKELESKKKRLIELERVLQKKDSVVQAIKEKVNSALYGFKDQGLDVHIKNGKVYVSMDEKLLFPSGSSEIDQSGVAALKKLARVLERNPDINIMVEGHTDDVPYISDEAIKDNWDLSVKRATAVVRVLLNSGNIKGKRIIAAGRSKYLPLQPNTTEEGKRKNRRTEIILTPKLGKLLQILNTH